MKEHFELFGRKVRDVVTGFEGVVTSVSFDLYGCVQAIVTPEHKADAKESEGASARWFDMKRLVALSATPVMALPSFEPSPITFHPEGVRGPEAKPVQSTNPIR